MRLLYIGDIMGRPGRQAVAEILPHLKREFAPDITVAQAENVSHGVGMSVLHYRELQALGIDFFTAGNHTLRRDVLAEIIGNPDEPVLRPANLPAGAPGPAFKYLDTPHGKLAFISLLGSIFPRPVEVENPLRTIETILKQLPKDGLAGIIVNFHGDMSSEKRVIGYYLDGRVTAVIGDHWHVPTADAMILPNGTAHITDVGMCGALHSSLGIDLGLAVKRWRDEHHSHNIMAEERPFQFNAVLIEFDSATRLAAGITQIQRTIE